METTHISIGHYNDNLQKRVNGVNGQLSWTQVHPGSKIEDNITGFFHTHPSGPNINDIDRLRASAVDLESRDSQLEKIPSLRFYIITAPEYRSEKYPLKKEYTND